MGKIQSKHGSYNAEKQRKKMEAKALKALPTVYQPIPENLIYQDRRATSMIIVPKPNRVQNKRPMTFIQTKDEYKSLRDDIKTSVKDFKNESCQEKQMEEIENEYHEPIQTDTVTKNEDELADEYYSITYEDAIRALTPSEEDIPIYENFHRYTPKGSDEEMSEDETRTPTNPRKSLLNSRKSSSSPSPELKRINNDDNMEIKETEEKHLYITESKQDHPLILETQEEHAKISKAQEEQMQIDEHLNSIEPVENISHSRKSSVISSSSIEESSTVKIINNLAYIEESSENWEPQPLIRGESREESLEIIQNDENNDIVKELAIYNNQYIMNDLYMDEETSSSDDTESFKSCYDDLQIINNGEYVETFATGCAEYPVYENVSGLFPIDEETEDNASLLSNKSIIEDHHIKYKVEEVDKEIEDEINAEADIKHEEKIESSTHNLNEINEETQKNIYQLIYQENLEEPRETNLLEIEDTAELVDEVVQGSTHSHDKFIKISLDSSTKSSSSMHLLELTQEEKCILKPEAYEEFEETFDEKFHSTDEELDNISNNSRNFDNSVYDNKSNTIKTYNTPYEEEVVETMNVVFIHDNKNFKEVYTEEQSLGVYVVEESYEKYYENDQEQNNETSPRTSSRSNSMSSENSENNEDNSRIKKEILSENSQDYSRKKEVKSKDLIDVSCDIYETPVFKKSEVIVTNINQNHAVTDEIFNNEKFDYQDENYQNQHQIAFGESSNPFLQYELVTETQPKENVASSLANVMEKIQMHCEHILESDENPNKNGGNAENKKENLEENFINLEGKKGNAETNEVNVEINNINYKIIEENLVKIDENLESSEENFERSEENLDKAKENVNLAEENLDGFEENSEKINEYLKKKEEQVDEIAENNSKSFEEQLIFPNVQYEENNFQVHTQDRSRYEKSSNNADLSAMPNGFDSSISSYSDEEIKEEARCKVDVTTEQKSSWKYENYPKFSRDSLNEFELVKEITESVREIRQKIENGERNTKILTELMFQMRRTNSISNDDFNYELLNMQQIVLDEIQLCIEIINT